MRKMALVSAVALGMALTGSAMAAAEGPMNPIAGLNPSSRPADAPVITQVSKSSAWFEHALKGVDAPYPPSLKFLEDQGNWYTPFTIPGMTGSYDIRRWHK